MFLLWQTTTVAVEATQEAAEGGAGESGAPHLFNIITYLSERLNMPVLEGWINVIYSFAIMLIVFLFFSYIARNMKKEPGRLQNFVEMIFNWLDGFVAEMLGSKSRKYVALVGSLFIYILFMNLFGLFPVVGHSPSSNLNITLSLALIVFITAQIHGMRELGFVGYLAHFADLPAHGKPTIIQLCLSPLMLVLHIIGELAKPMSLSLRLFGNITGEDTLIAIFVILLSQFFIPLQTFMYPIAILGGFIQALVFALLTAVYLMQMSAHEEH
jgi:F-type H+-transporting ATPase subunit a